MRGSIIQRSKLQKDKWTVIIEYDPDPITGKRRQKWVTVKGTQEDAEKKRTELLRQKDTGGYVHTGKIRVSDYLDRWLAEYAKSHLSPRGIERYSYIVNAYLKPVIGKLQLTKLQPEHLQKMYTDWQNKGLSAGTIKYHHAVLHKSLATALKWGLIARNVADSVDVPKIKRTEMQTWDENELASFLETAKNSPYYELCYIVLFTGMRRSEILGLRWQDIDLVLGQISVNRGLHHLKNGSYVFTQPKSAKSRRMISLSPSAILLLKRYRDNLKMDYAMLGKPLTDDTLVFSELGKPYRPNTITRAWSSMAKKAGVKVIRFHDARHTHASLMLKQGIHPKIVQERLGHSTIAMTLDVYSHVAPGLQEAAAQRFDEIIPVSKSVSKSQIVK